MLDIESIVDSLTFRFQSLGWLDLLDLLLVALAIYVLLLLLRRSQAAFVLRGVLVLAGLFLLANVLLPLPTFGIILTVSALAILITVPIVLQPELRRWLERFGRRVGFSFSGSESVAGHVVPEIERAVEDLAESKTGALIVIEGGLPLTETIDTGVRVNATVTAELLETIFFDKTPLHDGAVVIRDDEVVAAGCVLPLSDQQLLGWRRLGTRHRAAVGMSEVSDALMVVVSEETGTTSIASDGKLRHDLERTELNQALRDFYTRDMDGGRGINWRIWENRHFPGPRNLLVDLLYLILALVLALAATTAVRYSSNPVVRGRQENVPLTTLNQPADMVLTTTLPRTVVVEYEAPESELPSIGVSTFQATVDLEGISSGVTRVPVVVTSTSTSVDEKGAIPAEVDVSSAVLISKAMPVTVEVENVDALSTAYEINGQPAASPSEVTIGGPEPAVERVASVVAIASVANATTTVRQQRPLIPVDADGVLVGDVTVDPQETEVTVFVRRRINARDVGVRTVTTGSPPDGYWLSGLTVDPSSVTLQGNPGTLVEIGSFVDTLPVDLSEATGVMVVAVPLDLPSDVEALDGSGNGITNVTVRALVAPRSSDLLTTRPVEVVNDRGTMTIEVDPGEVQLLLSGPLPTLNQIELEPDLVQVTIDAQELLPGRSVEVTPTVVAPPEIDVQVVETSVLVTTESLQ